MSSDFICPVSVAGTSGGRSALVEVKTSDEIVAAPGGEKVVTFLRFQRRFVGGIGLTDQDGR